MCKHHPVKTYGREEIKLFVLLILVPVRDEWKTSLARSLGRLVRKIHWEIESKRKEFIPCRK